jgi:hypothetical protein
VKRELGLPTFKRKRCDLYVSFYHLLQRAKNIYLLYNTESEGLDAGEKPILTQLEVEKQKIIHFRMKSITLFYLKQPINRWC